MAVVRSDSDGLPVELGSMNGLTGRFLRPAAFRTAYDRRCEEERLLQVSRLFERVASGHALPDILDAVCGFVERHLAADCTCAVFCMDRRGLQSVAAPHLPASFNESIGRSSLGFLGESRAAAAHLKSQVIAVDLESEPWAATPFRHLALTHGYRSCWSTPILSAEEQLLGTLAVLHSHPARPTSMHLDLIAGATNIARIAIERARHEAALRRSESFLAEAQRLSSTGSFSWHLDSDEIVWSEQLYRIFEIEPGRPVTAAMIRSRVHPEDRPLLDQMLVEARRHRRDLDHEHRLLMPDRTVKYVHLVARCVRDRCGRFEYIGAAQDVTRRRVAEENLGKARSDLDRVARTMSLSALTASIAHEVTQPICGIITNAGTCLRMLGAEAPDLEAARETARRTLRDGARASEVIARLRALFAGGQRKTDPVDLNEATREVIALSLAELQMHRVAVRCELADQVPVVFGDRVQLQQVIRNLVMNACEAMATVEEGSRQLLIRTELDGEDRVRLSVTDAGAGLEAQVMARLFEPFYTTKPHGMGMGLFVCRSIVAHHGGDLRVTANQGPGVTVSFSIAGRGSQSGSFINGSAGFGAIGARVSVDRQGSMAAS